MYGGAGNDGGWHCIHRLNSRNVTSTAGFSSNQEMSTLLKYDVNNMNTPFWVYTGSPSSGSTMLSKGTCVAPKVLIPIIDMIVE